MATHTYMVMHTYAAGDIMVDGKGIGAYNVSFLRSQMGLVQQEPSLFADSILVSPCTYVQLIFTYKSGDVSRHAHPA